MEGRGKYFLKIEICSVVFAILYDPISIPKINETQEWACEVSKQLQKSKIILIKEYPYSISYNFLSPTHSEWAPGFFGMERFHIFAIANSEYEK